MTGYTVHTGASKKFTEGWDNIFEKKKPVLKAGTKKKPLKKKSETDAKVSSKDGVKKKKNKKKKKS